MKYRSQCTLFSWWGPPFKYVGSGTGILICFLPLLGTKEWES